jgi:predicted TIM-barrel fold metal-dependent hydrolase
MKSRGWHIQMYTNLAVISGIKDLVLAAPVPVVFDHFGGTQAALGLEQPGFSDLIALVRAGKAYVKISDVEPFAKALIAANMDQIIWGTDWPHPNSSSGNKATEVTPLFQIDDGRLMNQLAVWAPDPTTRRKILVDNPARLYQF